MCCTLVESYSIHRLLQLGNSFIEALCHNSRGNLGKSEEHHIPKDFDIVGVITNTTEDLVEKFIEVNLAETCLQLNEVKTQATTMNKVNYYIPGCT